MDEVQILRDQVSLERRHMAEVKNACVAALAAGLDESTLDGFCRSCAEYLLFIMPRFEAQDRRHCEQLAPRLGPEDGEFRAVLEDLERTLEAGRAALAELAAAVRARVDGQLGAREFIDACRRYTEFFNSRLSRRRHVIHPLLQKHYRIEDWRAASFVDADSILEERERYERVRQSLPAGIELRSAGRPS